MHEIGFVQGRLSSPVKGRTQAFPVASWRTEFPIAEAHGFGLMEWVVDIESLDTNPLLSPAGQREIRDLCTTHGVRIGSVMCDFLMVRPFYRGSSGAGAVDSAAFEHVVDAAIQVGIPHVIIPLVDGGRLETDDDEAALRDGLDAIIPALTSDTGILVESDYSPARLAEFMTTYPTEPRWRQLRHRQQRELGIRSGERVRRVRPARARRARQGSPARRIDCTAG